MVKLRHELDVGWSLRLLQIMRCRCYHGKSLDDSQILRHQQLLAAVVQLDPPPDALLARHGAAHAIEVRAVPEAHDLHVSADGQRLPLSTLLFHGHKPPFLPVPVVRGHVQRLLLILQAGQEGVEGAAHKEQPAPRRPQRPGNVPRQRELQEEERLLLAAGHGQIRAVGGDQQVPVFPISGPQAPQTQAARAGLHAEATAAVQGEEGTMRAAQVAGLLQLLHAREGGGQGKLHVSLLSRLGRRQCGHRPRPQLLLLLPGREPLDTSHAVVSHQHGACLQELTLHLHVFQHHLLDNAVLQPAAARDAPDVHALARPALGAGRAVVLRRDHEVCLLRQTQVVELLPWVDPLDAHTTVVGREDGAGDHGLALELAVLDRHGLHEAVVDPSVA
mmetsp:Transcript_79505/g.233714  ORF Transcript_79505/g.233714 Transcript_79505/m.233714 type:complete len:389 (+) Transcript_79505:460-1626(+)